MKSQDVYFLYELKEEAEKLIQGENNDKDIIVTMNKFFDNLGLGNEYFKIENNKISSKKRAKYENPWSFD